MSGLYWHGRESGSLAWAKAPAICAVLAEVDNGVERNPLSAQKDTANAADTDQSAAGVASARLR